MKVKILALATFAAAALSPMAGCNSDTTDYPSPRDVTGILKYPGATYAPFHFRAPYKFAIYDINDGFIAYVDTTKIVMPQINSYRDKLVEIRGTLLKDDGDPILRAESIRIKR